MRRTADRVILRYSEGSASSCKRRRFFGVPQNDILLTLLLGLVTLSAQSQASRDSALKGVGITQNLGAQIPPELVFQDHTGRDVRLGELFTGKRPIILTLVYFECPMLCTVELNELTGSLNAMTDREVGKDFDIITVSFDPNEKPALAAAKRAEYLRSYGRPGANSGWHFLTGSPQSIKALTDAAGFHYAVDPVPDPLHPGRLQYLHAGGIMVLTPSGKVSKYFLGLNYAPKDLRVALADAGRERQGSLAEAVLLFCFHYDPASGRYTLAILKLIKVAAGMMLVVFGLVWVRSMYRERRKTHGHEYMPMPPGRGAEVSR